MAERIAVVTGGTGGLGATISTKLHDHGYIVVITHSPSNTNISETLRRLQIEGLQLHVPTASMSPTSIRARPASRRSTMKSGRSTSSSTTPASPAT